MIETDELAMAIIEVHVILESEGRGLEEPDFFAEWAELVQEAVTRLPDERPYGWDEALGWLKEYRARESK